MTNIAEVMRRAREQAEAQTPEQAARAALNGGVTHDFVKQQDDELRKEARSGKKRRRRIVDALIAHGLIGA